MKRSAGWLIAGSIVFWLVLVYPARRLWGDLAVLQSAVAVLVCLVPTVATLVWARRAFQQPPAQQLFMVLGGTGLRMAFVLVAGLILYRLVPAFQQPSFWMWILAFYLFTLALEMMLLLSRRSVADDR